MPSYFITATDLAAAQEKQNQLCRWYLEGRTVVPQPDHTKQGPLKAYKYNHNLQVVARYLLENLNSHVSIDDIARDVSELLVLSYTSNQWRHIRRTNVLEEIREVVRVLYVDAYHDAGGRFDFSPVVVTHDHHQWVDVDGQPRERPIGEFAPNGKGVDRHATGRALTGRTDRNPPALIIGRNARWLIEYTGRLLAGRYTLKTRQELNAICTK